jgi:hypothetical protein
MRMYRYRGRGAEGGLECNCSFYTPLLPLSILKYYAIGFRSQLSRDIVDISSFHIDLRTIDTDIPPFNNIVVLAQFLNTQD